MNNTQRKKIKMLYSFKEGYFKPPYPYSSKVRYYPTEQKAIWRHYKWHYGHYKLQSIKFHAGCRLCNGYGYVHTSSYNETEDCVCVTEHNGTYSKKAYRI